MSQPPILTPDKERIPKVPEGRCWRCGSNVNRARMLSTSHAVPHVAIIGGWCNACHGHVFPKELRIQLSNLPPDEAHEQALEIAYRSAESKRVTANRAGRIQAFILKGDRAQAKDRQYTSKHNEYIPAEHPSLEQERQRGADQVISDLLQMDVDSVGVEAFVSGGVVFRFNVEDGVMPERVLAAQHVTINRYFEILKGVNVTAVDLATLTGRIDLHIQAAASLTQRVKPHGIGRDGKKNANYQRDIQRHLEEARKLSQAVVHLASTLEEASS